MNKLINDLQLMIMQNEDVIYDLGLDGVELEKEHQEHLKEENKYYERVITELQGLEKLKKELGIDLLTLFKVLKNGIYINLDNIVIFKPSTDLSLNFYLGNWYIVVYHSLNAGKFYFALKDYKKTWWLKEDLVNE